MDIVQCLKTSCSQDKEQKFKMQTCVLGLGSQWWLFESFVLLVLILIYTDINIHRVLKFYLLLDVLSVGPVSWLEICIWWIDFQINVFMKYKILLSGCYPFFSFNLQFWGFQNHTSIQTAFDWERAYTTLAKSHSLCLLVFFRIQNGNRLGFSSEYRASFSNIICFHTFLKTIQNMHPGFLVCRSIQAKIFN